jgi:uncharacterized protein YciI
VDLERYTFVLLRRPTDSPDYPEKRLDELREQHLAHLQSLRDRGVLLLAGPFRDQPDVSLRGLCLLNASVEETRALTADDPSVRARWLAPEIMSWLTHRGSLLASESS